MTKDEAIKTLVDLYSSEEYVIAQAAESRAIEILGEDKADKLIKSSSVKTLYKIIARTKENKK